MSKQPAPSDLEERPGVLSASRNQHALTVVCADHSTAVDLADELGGEVVDDRMWTVQVRNSSKGD